MDDQDAKSKPSSSAYWGFRQPPVVGRQELGGGATLGAMCGAILEPLATMAPPRFTIEGDEVLLLRPKLALTFALVFQGTGDQCF